MPSTSKPISVDSGTIADFDGGVLIHKTPGVAFCGDIDEEALAVVGGGSDMYCKDGEYVVTLAYEQPGAGWKKIGHYMWPVSGHDGCRRRVGCSDCHRAREEAESAMVADVTLWSEMKTQPAAAFPEGLPTAKCLADLCELLQHPIPADVHTVAGLTPSDAAVLASKPGHVCVKAYSSASDTRNHVAWTASYDGDPDGCVVEWTPTNEHPKEWFSVAIVPTAGFFNRDGKWAYWSWFAGATTVQSGTAHADCFRQACTKLGVVVPVGVASVQELTSDQREYLVQRKDCKILLKRYRSHEDPRNHIAVASPTAKATRIPWHPLGEPEADWCEYICTSTQYFFSGGNEFEHYQWFADPGFGADLGGARNNGRAPPAGVPPASDVPYAESVEDGEAKGGSANVSGAVVRRARRGVTSVTSARIGAPVVRGYRVAKRTMFNNLDEVYQDRISRDYAQEIIVELFRAWEMPFDQEDAMRYAEDLLWAFMIATTASDKANYAVEFEVPVLDEHGRAATIMVNFKTLSDILMASHGKTRRQFARAVADDLRSYLEREENIFLLPDIAARAGCDLQMASLAFDGSTCCKNLDTRQLAFVKTLEARNLFEQDDVIAQGASGKLLAGYSSGSRIGGRLG